MSDDLLTSVIDETLELRRRLVSELTKDIGFTAKDKDSATILLKALDGMDRAVIGKTRAATEEKALDTDKEAMRIADELIRKIGDGSNPFKANVAPTDLLSRDKPKVSRDIADTTDIPEHVLETGKSNETIDEFRARMDGKAT